MAATGFTPIQLYRTSTASATPTAGNLADGELAINLTDEKLYFKNAAGVVKLLASNAATTPTTPGGSNTQVQYNSSGSFAGSANLTFDGTTLTAAGLAGPHNGTVGATTPSTGAFTTLTTSSTVTLNGGTANGVPYLNGSKVLTSGSSLQYDGTSFSVGTTPSATYRMVVDGGASLGGIRVQGTLPRFGAFADGSASIGTGPNYYFQSVTGGSTYAASMQMGPTAEILFFRYPNTSWSESARFSATGGFSVGTTSDPGAGAIYATGNITAYFSSDIKFKENVRDIPNAAATAAAIGGKLFDWTDAYIADHGGADGYFVQKHDFGVIAQDVQKVFPLAVRTRQDGSLAVDYEKLSSLALAAVAEQETRIAKLEALVATLMKG